MANFARCISLTLYSRAFCCQVKKTISPLSCTAKRYFSLSNVHLTKDRKYAEKHEWISTDGKIGTVGISQYAQDSLGDVVFVQLPEVGQEIAKDGEAGVVESVKAVNELYCPVSGTVTEVNEDLTDKPNLINESCFDKGWIFKIEMSDSAELDTLMDEETYQKYLKSIH